MSINNKCGSLKKMTRHPMEKKDDRLATWPRALFVPLARMG